MTGAASRPHRKDTATDKLVAGTLGQVISLISWFLLAVAASILLEWIGVFAGWWDTNHAHDVLLREVSYLSHMEANDLLGLHPTRLAESAVERVNSLYLYIGVERALNFLEARISLVYYALSSAIDVSYTLVIRMVTVLLAIPAFFLWGLLGLVDGLVDRDIRKACGGIESSFIYHRTKALIRPSIAISGGLYLTLPFTINPGLFFLIPQVIFFLAVYYFSAFFKKFV